MGYRIEYDAGTAVTERTKSKDRKPKIKTAALLLVAGLVAGTLVWPKGRAWARDLLLPGDEAVTAQALEDLAEDLAEGGPVSEAVEAFCRQIIENG